MSEIAIIGMACRYAEVSSPRKLWENVLAQRRSFRRMPRMRLRLEEYSADRQAEDRISVQKAAVLEDYQFDRVRFHISRSTFESTDMAHWLALDVAAQALEDAKLLDASDDQRERIGVYVGNSLTGEFSRANLMRLRWPYVQRVLAAVLSKSSRNGDLEKIIAEVESLYKRPFPATTEESLVGGLSNTIAGRICNYFNLKGGGYIVDGACASSLLAIITACSALENHDVDIAIAGGVDLSLDPFELAGFSKLGALAGEKMRVFDERSAGFWPGEGCGMVVLMRSEEAMAAQHFSYAVIRGWGTSSDGSGGTTRPEVGGQLLALRRAYQRAGYGIDSVAYFEGHGTGTSVGDATELQALSTARRETRADAPPAVIGSIKANIGHTKAAAGVAGLIKAAIAVQTKILPPTTGCERPHPEIAVEKPMLRVLKTGELWPESAPVRAGVSAMGFGGINTHVTLEAVDHARRKSFHPAEKQRLASAQDSEIFLFQAADAAQLAARLEEIRGYAGEISYAEMGDLAAHLAREAGSAGDAASPRAACVASSPGQLEAAVKKLHESCVQGVTQLMDASQGIFFSAKPQSPRVGLVFPGQGSPVYTDGGMWARRFPSVRELYQHANLPQVRSLATETVQPCVVAASLAGLRMLELSGIEAGIALGHSLGELTALCWAGVCDAAALLRIVFERGRIMAQKAVSSGAMASLRMGAEDVERRLNGDALVIAAHNAPGQTVISGEARAIKEFVSSVAREGVSAAMLPVSHAFHSPLVRNVAGAFSRYLEGERFGVLRRRVASTVTGALLEEPVDMRELLATQITAPVQFFKALSIAAAESDILIEVGPGAVLSEIGREFIQKPIIPLDAASESLRGLFLACGAVFALGGKIRVEPLFDGRFFRPFVSRHTFLASPCEAVDETVELKLPAVRREIAAEKAEKQVQTSAAGSVLEALRNLAARRTELPLSAIKPESRFLDDLHLNSITVSQIILEAAAQSGLPAPAIPAEYANTSIREAAEALEATASAAPAATTERYLEVDEWIRVLDVELVAQPLRKTVATVRRVAGNQADQWTVEAMQSSPLRDALEQRLHQLSGSGVICCAPSTNDPQAAKFLFESLQAAARKNVGQIVLAGSAAGVSSLARSIYLEDRGRKVTVLDLPENHPEAAAWVMAEIHSARGFTEAHYGKDGVRREPRLKLLWPDETSDEACLNAADVLLVTGGGKGIAAECALALSRDSGCRLALAGRSDPARDEELKLNLRRFAGFGTACRYFALDVSDEAAVASVIRQIESEWGGVTAILHGAGANAPKRMEEITPSDLESTIAPKARGLRNILTNIDPAKLRVLIAFGSIIGRLGLQGEGHYALANEWLGKTVEAWKQEHPECRCLNLEWSVWAGAGMGQKLGVLESLMRQGITPLPMEEAIAMLKTLLAWKDCPASPIVTGRFGNPATLPFQQHDLPLRRFLERVQVYYPGIELVADAHLSSDADPYVAEHVFHGEPLFPAVCGLEAMAQAAIALEDSGRLPEFRNVRFEHPIVVPREKPAIIRIAALRRMPGKVSVVVRCSSTSFQVDHFSAECVFGEKRQTSPAVPAAQVSGKGLPLDCPRSIYDDLLFHHGRFRRIEKYFALSARESVVGLSSPSPAPWFARHLPAGLSAGDAASRDAAIHSIQACIPHKTVLPVGVDRVLADADWTGHRATIRALERVRDGNNFMYDLEIRDEQGRVCEIWQGLHLRAVAPIARTSPWPLPLLLPYLERKLSELLAVERLQITLDIDLQRQQQWNGEEALQQTLTRAARAACFSSGKAEAVGVSEAAPPVHASHSGPLTLLVCADDIGCDLQEIAAQEESAWQKLIGQDGLALSRRMAKRLQSSFDAAASQVKTIKEALRKCGARPGQEIVLDAAAEENWTTFSAGQFRAAAFHTAIEGFGRGFAFGFAMNTASLSLRGEQAQRNRGSRT